MMGSSGISTSRSFNSNLQAGKLRHRAEWCQQPGSFGAVKERVRSTPVTMHPQIFVLLCSHQDPDATGLQGGLDTLAGH